MGRNVFHEVIIGLYCRLGEKGFSLFTMFIFTHLLFIHRSAFFSYLALYCTNNTNDQSFAAGKNA